MKTKSFLKVTDIFIIDNIITETKVIRDKLYIADNNHLYLLDKVIKPISTENFYYLDALEDEDNKQIFMSLDQSKQKVTYKNNQDIKYEILLSQKVKKLFLFYSKGYGVVLLEDNSIDIYNINFNEIITNIKLPNDIISLFKSHITNQLIIIEKNKISFFDIETFNIAREIDIDDSSFVDVSLIKNNIYLIYNDKIRIIEKDETIIDIDINIDEKIEKVFTNIYQDEIIITTKNNSIYLYHPLSKSIFKILSYDTPIQDVRFMDSDIFISTQNKIIKIDTTQGALEFEKHLVLEEVNEAFEILKDNPFLILDEMFFKSLSKLWHDRYNKISNKLLMNKIDDANDIFENFQTLYIYKKEFEKVINLSDTFILLSHSLRTINYTQVFDLLEQNPILKETPIGKKILHDWEQGFEKFVFSLLKYKFDKQNKEFVYLQKYFGVESKKQLILFSIENQTVILSAIQAFKNKKYSLYTKLLDKYFFLNELPITKRINKIGENIYLKVLKFIEINELNDSLPMLETLENFTQYKSKSMILKEKVNVFLGFESSYGKGNYERCRMFLEQYNEHFYNTSYYSNIVWKDTKKIDASIVFINNNDFEKSYLILQEFFKSQIWACKIRHLMIRYYKQQFIIKEKNLSDTNLKLFIVKFHDLFGYIDDIFPEEYFPNIHKRVLVKEQIMNYPKTLH